MTFSEGQQPAVDPEASLRIELTSAIAAAQIDIANAIAELARSGADSAALANQGHALQQLQRTVGSANLGGLLSLRSEVAAASSSATALANQAISTAAIAITANANLSPTERARASIAALSRDLFENKVLDPYLQFTSAKDEEDYRKRERERKEEIDRAMALGTPEGVRRAGELAEDQLRDAGAHRADRSPEFGRLMATANVAQELTTNTVMQGTAHPSAEPAPSNDVADIAATLRAAGLSAAPPTSNEGGHGLSFDKLAAVGRTNDGRG